MGRSVLNLINVDDEPTQAERAALKARIRSLLRSRNAVMVSDSLENDQAFRPNLGCRAGR